MSDFVFDSDAAAAYVLAAGQVADMLGRAADAAEIVAGIDLSTGLGILGADFAAAFASAWASQGETVRLAANLVTTYGQVITTHGRDVITVEGDNVAALNRQADDIEAVA